MPTIRDNLVIIRSDLIESVNFVPDSIVVTSNQPYKHYVDISYDDGVYGIRIQSGRKKSKPVAEKFSKASGGMGHMFATQGGKVGYPDELNFFFSIDVIWKSGDETTIHLGQGSNAMFRNNWWIGASEVKNNKIKISNKTYTIVPTSIQEDEKLDKSFDTLIGKIPPQFSGFVNAFGRSVFKEFFKSVNMFKIE